MSKKKKDKFKKQIKAQVLQEMTQTKVAPAVSEAPIVELEGSIPKQAQPTKISDANLENLPQIKYDLKKTIVVIGILALIIATVVILDQKYNILLNLGNVLFKIFHIQ